MTLYPPSDLDASQIIQHSYDDASQTLRTTAVATIITPPALEVIITNTDDSIAIGTSTDLFTSTTIGPKIGLDINVINSSIEVIATDLDIRDLTHLSDSIRLGDGTNFLTTTAQAGSKTSLDISAFQSGTWNITNISGIISLPTGASTSALQTTGNTSLSSIDGKLNSLGQKTMANSVPVVIASDQSVIPVSQSGTWTVQPGNTANTTAWLTTNASLGPVTPGTVATKSTLVGGQYNSTLPTLTTTQQAALQLDAKGRLITTANPVFSSNLKIEPTFTTVAISSTSVYTTLYSYSGSGQLAGFNYEFNAGRAIIKVVVDGNTIMDGFDIATLNGLYALTNNSARLQLGSGLTSQSSNLDFSFRWPILFYSSVIISAKLSSGASLNFNQGIVYIQKDT